MDKLIDYQNVVNKDGTRMGNAFTDKFWKSLKESTWTTNGLQETETERRNKQKGHQSVTKLVITGKKTQTKIYGKA